MTIGDPYAVADMILGRCGRLLNSAKQQAAGQRIVWNANVCAKSYGKVWYGDIDLNASGEQLRELARTLGEPIYVLREHDARFKNEANPLYDKAVEEVAA